MGESKSGGTLRPPALFAHLVASACVMLSCAELLPSTEPGTPGGGAYCNQAQPGAGAKCYPTEAQREAAYHAEQDEKDRPAREAAVIAATAQEAGRQKALRAEEQQKASDEAAARQERERKTAAFVAERDRKEAAREAAARAVHNMALDKEYAGPAISAIMCSIDSEIIKLKADLAHEKRVTATGGVINLKARNDIASDLVDDSDELEGWRKALVRVGASRLPCKSVVGVEECHHGLAQCDGKTHDVAQVWTEELETLWGSNQPHPNR